MRGIARRLPANALWFATISLFFLAGLMVAWSSLIAHNLPRAEKLIGPVPQSLQRDLMVIGTDFEEYRDYFRNYPKTLGEVEKDNVFSEFHKRPLYGPVSSTLNIFLNALGITFPNSMLVILSLYAASCSILLYFLLHLMGLPRLQSVLLTAAATVSFGWLSVFSLPESYSLTICAMLVAMISATYVLRVPEENFKTAVLAHAGLLGVCGWLYLPIAGALLLVVPRMRSLRESWTIFLPAVLIIVAVAMFPHIAKGRDGVDLLITHGTAYSSLMNVVSVRNWIDVAFSFLIFSFVAPIDDVVSATSTLNWDYILRNEILVVWLVVGIAAYAAAFWLVIKRSYLLRVSGAAAWLLGLIVFYVYFNPREALLYLSLPVPLIIYMFAQVLSADGEGTVSRLKLYPSRAAIQLVAGVLLASVALMNLSAVLGP
jgi:hypothetical protein